MDAIPYGRQQVDERDIAAVAEVLRGDWLTTGPTVEAFEAALAEIAGGHPVVAVSSGTAALHAAYAAAGVGPGTNIVTTPLTFAATATAALHLGAEVRFADIDDETLLIDPRAVESLVDERTRGIVPVDFAGQPADTDALWAIADAADAVLIEDAAHSIGATSDGRPVGALADMTTFSFHPVKTITTGEGGAVVVRDERHLESVRRFRSHGLVRDAEQFHLEDEGPWHQEIHSLGLNYRMPDILAALGLSQLQKLPTFVARRAELVERYREALIDVPGLRLGDTRDGTEPAWHLFPVRVPGQRRRQVFETLRSAGILAQVHYLPVYRHPAIAASVPAADCPVAEAAYEELLSLPLYPSLTNDQQDRVIRQVSAALGT